MMRSIAEIMESIRKKNEAKADNKPVSDLIKQLDAEGKLDFLDETRTTAEKRKGKP